MKKTIGRSSTCDIIILDSKNRVSREHAVLFVEGGKVSLQDSNSSNGTYINGLKIPSGIPHPITPNDRVTLSNDYQFDVAFYLKEHFNIGASHQDQTLILNNPQITVNKGTQTVTFDPEKTAIADLAEIDVTPYKTIGRSAQNDFPIEHPNVSSKHLKIRMLSPEIIELIDLGSTNGTYADGKKLEPNKPFRFINSVEIFLSKTYLLNLKQLFPNIQLVTKDKNVLTSPKPGSIPPTNSPITKEELAAFKELENVWKEYAQRQQKANKVSSSYGMVGTAVGLALSVVTGGIGGAVVGGGLGLAGRYFGQQKSNEIRGDLTMEDMFLLTYACPRCKESFQKKPWVTIQDCFKCKIKFK